MRTEGKFHESECITHVFGQETSCTRARNGQGFCSSIAFMSICLSHNTALSVWRAARASLLPAPSISYAAVPEKVVAREVRALRDSSLSTIVALERPHLMVASQDGKTSRCSVVCHCPIASKAPPRLFSINLDVCVVSVEDVFAQVSLRASVEALMLLAFELCGSYSLLPDGSFVAAQPLTSVKRLASRVGALAPFPGSAKAATALRYSFDGAASPAEAKLAMLLCLRQTLGGYGFPVPRMNWRVDVTGDARKLTPRKYFVLDLFWADAMLDVEYDSNAFHRSPDALASNAERRNTLQAMGYTVITVTRDQMTSVDLFDDAARAIAKALHVRLRHSCKRWPRLRYGLRRRIEDPDNLLLQGLLKGSVSETAKASRLSGAGPAKPDSSPTE